MTFFSSLPNFVRILILFATEFGISIYPHCQELVFYFNHNFNLPQRSEFQFTLKSPSSFIDYDKLCNVNVWLWYMYFVTVTRCCGKFKLVNWNYHAAVNNKSAVIGKLKLSNWCGHWVVESWNSAVITRGKLKLSFVVNWNSVIIQLW